MMKPTIDRMVKQIVALKTSKSRFTPVEIELTVRDHIEINFLKAQCKDMCKFLRLDWRGQKWELVDRLTDKLISLALDQLAAA